MVRRAVFVGTAIWLLPFFIGNFAHDVAETYRTGELPLWTPGALAIMALVAFWPNKRERVQ